MTEIKWCESWEKNFDSTFKSVGKFKDDMKQKPSNLTGKTYKRCEAYVDLLIMELEEIKEQFSNTQNIQHKKEANSQKVT